MVAVAVVDEPSLVAVVLPVGVAASLSERGGTSVLTVNDLLVTSTAERAAVAAWAHARAGHARYCSLSEADFRRL